MLIKYLKSNWPFIILTLFFGTFFLIQTNFQASDLGRHITNGRLLFSSPELLSTNFYSYTYPDFNFINHHWLFGGFSYLIYSVFGFVGLTLINAIIAIGAFVISLQTGYLLINKSLKKNNISNFNNSWINWSIILSGLLAIPLITSRNEIRPEIISLLFIAYFLKIFINSMVGNDELKNIKKDSSSPSAEHLISRRQIIFLAILQIIWVNTHTFFFLGLLIIGYLLISKILYYLSTKSLNIHLKEIIMIAITFTSLFLVSFINPHGWRGIVYPLTFFDNYGYPIVENQSLLFLQNYFNNPIYYYVIGFFILTTILIGFNLFIKNIRAFLLIIFPLYLTFGLATWSIVRMSSFFGLVSIPILAWNINYLSQNPLIKNIGLKMKGINQHLIYSFCSLIVFAILTLALVSRLFIPFSQNFGLGLMPNAQLAGVFFREVGLTGPIFNNYDIGSYLIYQLYPNEPVFVDNRPEAYPTHFFEEVYMPAQLDNEVWQQLLNQYEFNSIFFYRHDLTEWGQTFLIQRISDDEWSPLYVDEYAIIFAKKNEKNQKIINQYQLPKDIFSIRSAEN